MAFRNGPIEDVHAGVECPLALENPSIRVTKHALNVHCGHDDVYGVLDTGWIIGFGKDQQAADQALILRRVSELSLTSDMNVQDGFLTSHTASTIPPYALDH